MVVCYAFEQRSRWFILGFAVACVLGPAYGFLQGAWPFGVVEAIWAIIALQRWARGKAAEGVPRDRAPETRTVPSLPPS